MFPKRCEDRVLVKCFLQCYLDVSSKKMVVLLGMSGLWMVRLKMKEGLRCVSMQRGEPSTVKGGPFLMDLWFADNLVIMITVSNYISIFYQLGMIQMFFFFIFPAAETTDISRYGPGTGPIAMDTVLCVGNEDRLIDCIFTLDTTEDSHMDDAGISCVPRKLL